MPTSTLTSTITSTIAATSTVATSSPVSTVSFTPDTWFQVIVTVVIGLLGLALTWFIYRRQTPARSMSIETISSIPLLQVEKDIKPKTKILYEDKEISDAYLVVVRFKNTGRLDIQTEDFEPTDPLRLQFIPWLSFLDTPKITSPAGLTGPKPEFEVSGDPVRIVFRPFLFKRGEEFTLSVVTTVFSSYIPVARMRNNVKVNLSERKIPKWREIFAGFGPMYAAFLFGMAMAYGSGINMWGTAILGILVFIISIVIMSKNSRAKQ